MRNRARRKATPPGQNLDSFLDVMTNTVGVLMFVSLFVSLVTVEAADSVIQTPLASESKKIPRFFEIRNNKVTYVDDEKVGKDMEVLMGNLPACNRPEFTNVEAYENYRSCIRSRAGRLVNFKTKTAHYNVTMTNAATFSHLYVPISNEQGENKEQLALKDSEFQRTLEKFKSKDDYIAFIVRPDSFSAFRAARKQAWKQGFQVGWEPHKEEDAITFGSGGKEIGVQ
jgi:hypothetical protein